MVSIYMISIDIIHYFWAGSILLLGDKNMTWKMNCLLAKTRSVIWNCDLLFCYMNNICTKACLCMVDEKEFNTVEGSTIADSGVKLLTLIIRSTWNSKESQTETWMECIFLKIDCRDICWRFNLCLIESISRN